MSRKIKVDQLARVEGEGALSIKFKDGKVADVQLQIFEPPRFFEAFLRGRAFTEAPDITARICGICPIAYQMSAVHALENALGVNIDGPVRDLRRLIYCGEWIESHALHVYLLHAPDFLGLPDAIELAKSHPALVEQGLQLKKIGNKIIEVVGGRAIHPINVRVGGFYKVPHPRDFRGLAEQLKWARETALQTVRWTATLNFPVYEQDYEFVSLRHPDEYPFNEGRLVSSGGLDISPREFDEYFIEEHLAHSNALHCAMKDRGAYLTGPLARFNLNFDKLSPLVQEAAREAGVQPVCRNIFQSIIIRSLEILYACDEALRIIENYEMPDRPAIEIAPHAATGYACTEAPRGTLYHRYSIDENGLITDAKIVPPTSQNQKIIEEDLRQYATIFSYLSDPDLTLQCEQAVRSYDPCISCATHFLRVTIERN